MIPIAQPAIGSLERERVDEVLASGMLADGPEVRAFEDAFADMCDVDHAIATSNGTTALHAALWALGIGEGDRVITTPFSFIASANAIRLCGGEPVFVDIDPATYNLDPELVEQQLRADDTIEAILPVHLYGLPADMPRFRALADTYDVHLIEDCAQAHGATVDGSPVGSTGDVGCFSFYPTKNMTTGEGGMITTDDDEIAKRAASFVNHGRVAGDRSYDHAHVGHNFRMTSIAAVLGQVQLDRLDRFVKHRREHADYLNVALNGSDVSTPTAPDGYRHVYHQYTIRSTDRDGLRETLTEHDIGAGVYYPRPIPDEAAYDGVDVDIPHARAAADEVLSLPVHPGLDSDDLFHIAEVVTSHAS